MDDDSRSLNHVSHLMSRWLLVKNVLWNAGGVLGTTAVVVITVPILIHQLGIERFGILTLIWTIIKYFRSCDIGMGQTLAKLISDRLGEDAGKDTAPLIRTVLLITMVFGLAGGALWAAACGPLVRHVFNVPSKLEQETLQAFYILVLAFPAMSCAEALRGALSAFQRFDLINAVRVPTDVISSLGLLAVLPFSHSLAALTGVLALGRVIQLMALLLACTTVAPGILRAFGWEWRAMVGALRFGGWLTVLNLVGPFLSNTEQFLIAVLLPADMLAFYAIPCEAARRLWYIPTIIHDVWFAALALSFAQRGEKAAALVDQVARILFLLMFPLTAIAILYGHEILGLWLGAAFAQRSGLILQLAALTVLIGALRTVPGVLMQAANRPDAATKLHLIEAPFYIVFSYFMIRSWGITGAALAQLARESGEAAAFVIMSHRIVPQIANERRLVRMLVGATGAGLTLMIVPANLAVRAPISVVVLGAFAVLGWLWLLEEKDREFIKARLNLAKLAA